MFKKLSLGLCLICALFLLTPRKINIMVSDIGRHLKNGEIFLTTGKIIDTNFYSYTEPDVPVINHHWLSGIIFYFIYSNFGFNGLSIFFSLLTGLCMYLIFLLAKRKAGFLVAASGLAFMIIFILSRLEIRPEGFSCLFFVLYFLILDSYKSGKIAFKYVLMLLALFQIIWVNLHIFFVLGPFIVGVYFLKALWDRESGFIRQYAYLLAVVIVVGVINPWGVYGLIEPFLIFRGYELKVVENLTIFYSILLHPQSVMARDYLIYFILTFVFGLLSPLIFTRFYSRKSNYVWYLVFLVFGLLTARIMRFVSFYGLYGVYFFTLLLSSSQGFLVYFKKVFSFILPLAFITLFLYSFNSPIYGIGLAEDSENAAEFYVNNRLKGPILNNYDNGSYIIFYLFPNEKVYIDGRPEAYTSAFQTNFADAVFGNMNTFRIQDSAYKFNTIFLPSSSLNAPTRNFILTLISANEWKPIYLDNHALILVKNIPANAPIIARNEILDIDQKLVVTKHHEREGIPAVWLFLIDLFS